MVNCKSFFMRFWPDALVVVLFAIISFAYFFPADTEGRILFRHDSSAGRGLGQETSEYYEKTGEKSRWTGSAFCGMPTYQSAPSYESSTTLNNVMNAYHLWLPENVWYVFAYLLGFYILLRAFDFRWYLASLGAVIWAFSSYFFIIIAAGHIWKVMALAYLPPMIAGVLLAYKGKYLQGLIVTGIFSAFEVNANHVQMTYYYLFIIAFLIIGFLVDAIRQKKYMHFVKATAVCAIGAVLGIGANISNLYHTWEYQKESMRGKSELVKANTGNQTSSGLERDYITQWSYGLSETWTLLVPNTKGGASVSLYANEIIFKGKTIINDKFWVDDDGIVYMNDANVSGTINAMSGKIAGFSISGNGLVNTGFNNDAYVIFRNDTYNTFAGIGGNVLPASSGMRAVARFENHDKTNQWGLGYNVAVIMSAKNSDYNLAFAGNGNGFLAGYIAGYGFQEKTCDKENTCFILHPKESLLFIVDVTKQKASIGLPSLFEIRMMLGIGANEEFAVPIEIIIKTCPQDSYGGTFIYGKNKNIDGMDTDNYPTTDWTQSWTYGQAGDYINDSFFRAGYNKFILSYRNSKYSAYAVVSSYYSYYADNS